MEIIYKFKEYLTYSFNQGSLGLSISEIIIVIILFLLSLIIRGFFAKIVVFKIKRIVKKTGNKIDDHLFDALSPPLKTLPIIFVFLIIGVYLDVDTNLKILFEKINRTLITVFIFWLLHQSMVPLSQAFQKLEDILSRALVLWLTKSLKYLVIILGIVAILETWGIKIGPVIAGLGLFGVAVALGAQDLFKNLISGLMIILEKRFKIGDIIEVPGHAIGSVEHIGFRSTLIRQFDSTPISVPNYVFSDSSIVNFSDREYRRINWTIGLTYETSIDQLKEICKSIEDYIRLSDNFIVNNTFKLYVRVEKFNESSIDILIHAFTSTNDWEQYLNFKEVLAFEIKKIVEKNNSSFAFPSQTIYLDK